MKLKAKIARRIGEPLIGQAKKVSVIRRNFPPGRLDSQRKHKTSSSEYKSQMKEKQKVRFSYGLKEHQFKTYVKKSALSKTPTDTLFSNLEYRLDNVVFRSGLANTRQFARQLVTHGHIVVNGKKLNVPSYQTKKGDVVAIREGSKGKGPFLLVKETIKDHKEPQWLKLNKVELTSEITSEPKDTEKSFNLQTVLELYSR